MSMIILNYIYIVIINILLNFVFMYHDRYKKLEKELEDLSYEKIFNR